jgi:sugar phosphate isomerase/epimerase
MTWTVPLPHRRDVLRGAAATVAGAALQPVAARTADPRRVVPLGFSLYGMPQLKLFEALQACARLGYDGVELALMPAWHGDPAQLSQAARRELRARLSDLGLQLPALMENLSLVVDDAQHRTSLERLKLAARLAHDLRPENPPLVETVLGGRPGDWDAVRRTIAERLADWARVAQCEGVRLALKAHVAGAAHRPEHLCWLLDQVDHSSLRAVYDYSHFQLRGIGLAESLDALLPRTAFVHVKDARGTPERFTFLLPGQGEVDYVEYFRRLQRASYAGFVVVEVSRQIQLRSDYDPLAAARACYARLDEARRQAADS